MWVYILEIETDLQSVFGSVRRAVDALLSANPDAWMDNKPCSRQELERIVRKQGWVLTYEGEDGGIPFGIDRKKVL